MPDLNVNRIVMQISAISGSRIEEGDTLLFMDEIHKCPDWTSVLKNLYDNFPRLHIVYTGSSMLRIDNSRVDLSRRQTLYKLNNLSFREYLEYEGIASFNPHSLEDILKNHVKYAMEITSKVKVLKYFEDYLSHGMYPFYKESNTDYHIRLSEAVTQTLESDIPAVEDVTFETVQKTEKLLMIIAESVPFVPNVNRLCEALGTTRDSCLKMLYALDRAGVLCILTAELKNYKKLVSPDKIFLGNPNIMIALGGKTEIGTIRETIFANQVGATNALQYPKKGDFFACRKYLFEVGGAGKSFEQIKDEPDSFLAVDDTEIAITEFERLEMKLANAGTSISRCKHNDDCPVTDICEEYNNSDMFFVELDKELRDVYERIATEGDICQEFEDFLMDKYFKE